MTHRIAGNIRKTHKIDRFLRVYLQMCFGCVITRRTALYADRTIRRNIDLGNNRLLQTLATTTSNWIPKDTARSEAKNISHGVGVTYKSYTVDLSQ
jgi:hypothetical protein